MAYHWPEIAKFIDYVLDKKLNWLERIRNIQMNKGKICLYADVLTGSKFAIRHFTWLIHRGRQRNGSKRKTRVRGVQNSLVLQTELRYADL